MIFIGVFVFIVTPGEFLERIMFLEANYVPFP